MFLQKGAKQPRIRDAHEKKNENVSKHMISVLFDNGAQMQGQTLNKYATKPNMQNLTCKNKTLNVNNTT